MRGTIAPAALDSIPRGSVALDSYKPLIAAGHVYINTYDRVCLTSDLHRAWFMRTFCQSSSSTQAIEHITDITACLFSIIQCWDLYVLQHICTYCKDGRPKETCFQMEMYRAGTTSFLPSTILCPKVGKGVNAQGAVDLFVPAPYAMAFEFTKDGSRVTEHLGRFLTPDKYEPMLSSGLVKQNVVVDSWSPRHVQQVPAVRHTRVQHKHLFTVLLSKSFTEAGVWHMGQSIRQLKIVGAATDATRAALLAALQRAGA